MTPAEPTAMQAQMLAAVRDAFSPYLKQVLEQNPPERHAFLRGQFDEHMAFLADFCLRGYPDAGGLTVAFIQGLHRACFPPDYRQEVTTRDGRKIWLVPGEFKTVSNNVCESYLHPGRVNVFLIPEKVPAAMRLAVETLNAALLAGDNKQCRQEAILFFVLDFLGIHPFVDANGRTACILADLLAVRANLPAWHFTRIKSRDQEVLTRVVEHARECRDLTPLRDILTKHGWPDEWCSI